MNQAQLIGLHYIPEKAGLSKADSKKAEAFVLLMESLKKDEKVALVGFRSFCI